MILEHLCVDMGASETRYISSESYKIRTAPNNYTLAISGKPKGDDRTSYEDNLDFSITNTDGSRVEIPKIKEPIFPVHLYMGSLAEENTLKTLKPDGLKEKMKQPINYYSIVLSAALSGLYAFSESDRSDTGILVSNVYILVPPMQSGREGLDKAVADILHREFEVTFHRLGKSLKIRFDNIHIKDEGHAAFMAYVLNIDGGSLTGTGKACKESKVLTLDIGASTTDIVVFEKLRYAGENIYTIKAAGNAVAGRFKTSLILKYAYHPPDEDLEAAVLTGQVRIQGAYKDVSELLNAAKEAVAQDIISGVKEFVSSRAMTLDQMSRILLCGGGSIEGAVHASDGSRTVVSPPLSEFIIEKIREYSEYIVIDRYGDHAALKTDDDSDIFRDYRNPRYANIIGLNIMAKKGL